MKKSFLLLAFFVLMPFVACNNETEPESTQEKLSKLTDNYIKDHENEAIPKWPPRWLKIVLADCAGAIGGAGLGGAVGAIVGGVVSSASVAAGTAGVNPPDPSFEPTVTWPAEATTSLPFDDIGFHHYELLNGWRLNSNDDPFSNDALFDYAEYYLVNQAAYFTQNQLSAYNPTISSYVRTITSTITDVSSARDVVDDLYSDGVISANVRDIMKSYFTAFGASSDLEDFTDYSVASEEIVAASTTLSSTEKMILMCSMSTMRVGAEYWQ